MRLVSALVIATSLAVAGCRSQPVADGAAGGSAERIAIGQLPDVDAKAAVAHAAVLSSDEFEGRAPATKGEQLTVGYLVDQFTRLGLKPGNPDGTFVQKVPLVGLTTTPAPLVITRGSQQLELRWRDEVVALTKHVAETGAIADSELVFVGYGVVAPEYDWDDFKGVDVKGKTIVVLVNDPPVPDPSNPAELDAKVFGGRAMTYYGRWTYKFETAAEKGAAGVLIVHETGPAGYPFAILQDSHSGEHLDLVTPDKNMGRAAIEGWVTVDAARRLMALAGHDYDALKKQAVDRAFRPVPLGLRGSMTLRNTLRTVNSQNVIARLDGADPALKSEYVVYTAHWDHYGKSPAGIFHGAQDDAIGCGALVEIARAFAGAPVPPKRSIVFLAVTSEEQGLLGSQYYTVMPLYPLTRTLADINLDPNGWNVYGRTKDVTLIGYGASDLDDYAREAAGEQGRVVHGDPEPEKGFYYRSDHFNFAKRGVPALEPEHGVEFIGKPADFGREAKAEWIERRYHKPADVVSPDWDLSGLAEDLKLYFAIGYRVAQAGKYPEWKPGNEFRAIREAQLAK